MRQVIIRKMRQDEKLVGVILAAGKGARIKPLNMYAPKPLLPVCNKPIMQYQIEEMRDLGIKEIFIVIGYLGTRIKKYFGTGRKLGVKIIYVRQKDQLGIAHAIGQLESYIKTPFLLFLGDIFYISSNLKKMVVLFNKSKKIGAVLAVTKEEDPQAIKKSFALILGKNNLVKRVIEKPRYVTNNLKGCGIYLFDLPIFDAIRNTPRTAMRDEYEITNAIQLLIDYGYPVYSANVVKWDMNITFAEDLHYCNLAQLKSLYQGKSLIAPGAKVNEKAEIVNSVVGEKVFVGKETRIINSVILDSSRVRGKKKIENCLVTPDGICRI